MKEMREITGMKMVPKEKKNLFECASRHLHTASQDLDNSKGDSNGAQEDALPPTGRKELRDGAVSVEDNVGVGW